ncbi:hypothetical protein DdX_17055 [Ditylenchus destructor]|uniref:Uncharacterized protein n=1 Tax=Ditylenchus destructor TaxID=166010 RepID=A0AAD4MMW8_9BILA|nr:hypothetical protein DdX_17055 [Ditylenchus destructor]
MATRLFISITALFALGSFCQASKVTYYGYIELCSKEFCYTVAGINVTYEQYYANISISCSTPTPLDMEETLPVAQMCGAKYTSGGAE